MNTSFVLPQVSWTTVPPVNSFFEKRRMYGERRAPLILLIGPEHDTRFMLKALLERWDFSVIDSSDVADSEEMFQVGIPDAVLIDVALHFDESLQIIESVKDRFERTDVPFILLAGFVKPEYRETALQHGATNLFEKPVDFDELRIYLNQLTRGGILPE
ncbi:MAG TPA: response regulator [Pyrinomonadaceae bacterium]|nr:response regulator [Pyrinomonadaceae bacterium]